MIQGIFRLLHRMGMTLEDFRAYGSQVHAPIVKSLRGLRYYQQSTVVDEAYRWADQRRAFAEEI